MGICIISVNGKSQIDYPRHNGHYLKYLQLVPYMLRGYLFEKFN